MMEPHEQSTTDNDPDATNPGGRLNPLQVIASVFAAGLGIQSSKNRKRDFKQGKAGVFIIAGLCFTVLFVAVVYGVVRLVLSSAGS